VQIFLTLYGIGPFRQSAGGKMPQELKICDISIHIRGVLYDNQVFFPKQNLFTDGMIDDDVETDVSV